MATASNLPSVQAVLDGLQYRSAQIEVGNTNDLGKWVTELKNAKTDTSKEISFLFKMNSTPVRIGFGVLFNGGTEARLFATDGDHFFRGVTNMDEEIVWEELTHDNLDGRDLPDQHPIAAIEGLTGELEDKISRETIRLSAGDKREVVTGLDVIDVTGSTVTVRQYKSNVDDGMANDYDMVLWSADETKAGLMGSDTVKAIAKAIDDIDKLSSETSDQIKKLFIAIKQEEAAREAGDKIAMDAIIEEARLARIEEGKLLAKILLEKKATEEALEKKIDKDAIRVSGNHRQQVVTALDYKIGKEDATVTMFTSDVVSKIHDQETATIPAATVDNAGLLSAFDKVLVDGAVQRKDIPADVITDVRGKINENDAQIQIFKSDVNDGKKTMVPITVPGASTSAAGLMTKADKEEQERVADQVSNLSDFADDLESDIADLDKKIGDVTNEVGHTYDSLTQWNLAQNTALKMMDTLYKNADSKLDKKIEDETERAKAAEDTKIAKSSIRESEGVRKMVTAITTQVTPDGMTANITEWSSDVEGNPHSATMAIQAIDGLHFEQPNRDVVRISGKEIQDAMTDGLDEAKAYADRLVEAEAAIREADDDDIRGLIEDEEDRATTREDEIEGNAFQKASVPKSGNDRFQLLTALDLTADTTGGEMVYTAHQFSVDVDGVPKHETMPLPNADQNLTGLMSSKAWRDLYSRVNNFEDATADHNHYPTTRAVAEFVVQRMNTIGQYEGTYDFIGNKSDVEALTGIDEGKTAITLDTREIGTKQPDDSWTWNEFHFDKGDYVFGRKTAGSNLGNSGMAIFNGTQFEYREDRERMPDNEGLEFNTLGHIALKLKDFINYKSITKRVLNNVNADNIGYTPDRTVADELIELNAQVVVNSSTIADHKTELDLKITELTNEVDKNKAECDGEVARLDDKVDTLRSEHVGLINDARTEAKGYTDALRNDVVTHFPKKADNAVITGGWTFDIHPQTSSGTRMADLDDVTDLESKLMTDHITPMSTDIDDLKSDVSGLGSRMDDVEDDVTRIGGELTVLDGKIDSEIASLDTKLSAEIDRLDVAVADLDGRTTDVEGRLDTAETTIDDHGTRISGLEARVTSLESGVDALEKSVMSLNGWKGQIDILTTNLIGDITVDGGGISVTHSGSNPRTAILNTTSLVTKEGDHIFTGQNQFNQEIKVSIGGTAAIPVVLEDRVPQAPNETGEWYLMASRTFPGAAKYEWVPVS